MKCDNTLKQNIGGKKQVAKLVREKKSEKCKGKVSVCVRVCVSPVHVDLISSNIPFCAFALQLQKLSTMNLWAWRQTCGEYIKTQSALQ